MTDNAERAIGLIHQHLVLPFSFDTDGLATGIVVPGWVPKEGDHITNGQVDVLTPWTIAADTRAQLDLYLGEGTDGLFHEYGDGIVDLTVAIIAAGSSGTAVPNNALGNNLWEFSARVMADADAVRLFATQDGTRSGSPIDTPTAGEAELHLTILRRDATP